MITWRNWLERYDGGSTRLLCSGWFLFGWLPLIVRKRNIDLPEVQA